jgi:hypothetical protein
VIATKTINEENWKEFKAYYYNAGEAAGKEVLISQKYDLASLSCFIFDIEGGILPQAQIDGLRKLGEWMAINKEALYAARCSPFTEGGVDTWEAGTIRFTEKGKYVYAIDLGNIWSPTVGFAEYKDSTPPKVPLTIPDVKPLQDSEIKMLGSNESLAWHQNGDDLVIESIPDNLPCDYAWAFKIQVR